MYYFRIIWQEILSGNYEAKQLEHDTSKVYFFMSRELLIFINVSHDNRERSEKFEDTKEVTRILKSKKDRQHKGQKKKDKRTNNYLQNITHKTKDQSYIYRVSFLFKSTVILNIGSIDR